MTRDIAAPAQTDSLVYHAGTAATGVSATIRVQYRNVTAERISFPHCNGAFAYHLEQRVDTGWVVAWAPDLQDCLSDPPIAVEADATIPLTFALDSGREGSNLAPQFAPGRWPPGIYRLVLDGGVHGYDRGSPGFGRAIELAARLSNAFILRGSSE